MQSFPSGELRVSCKVFSQVIEIRVSGKLSVRELSYVAKLFSQGKLRAVTSSFSQVELSVSCKVLQSGELRVSCKVHSVRCNLESVAKFFSQ